MIQVKVKNYEQFFFSVIGIILIKKSCKVLKFLSGSQPLSYLTKSTAYWYSPQLRKREGGLYIYKPMDPTGKSGKKYRSKPIIWFNPHFSQNVKNQWGCWISENCGFLLSQGAPPLRPLINRNTLKVSYRTMANMKQVISRHNKKVSAAPPASDPPARRPWQGKIVAKLTATLVSVSLAGNWDGRTTNEVLKLTQKQTEQQHV